MGICEWNKGTCWHLTTDPDTTQRRLEAMERARMKLQEEHDAKAAMYAEQQKQVSIYVWPNSCRRKCKLCLIAVLLNTHQTGGQGIYNIVYTVNGQSCSMNRSGYFMGIMFFNAMSERRRKTETENRRMGESTGWEGIQVQG